MESEGDGAYMRGVSVNKAFMIVGRPCITKAVLLVESVGIKLSFTDNTNNLVQNSPSVTIVSGFSIVKLNQLQGDVHN